MKKFLCSCTLGLLVTSVCYAQDSKLELDKLIEKRVEANRKLTTQVTEDVKEMPSKDLIVPLEKTIGESWDKLLKHVKKSDDIKLKVLLLRTELQGDLVYAYYDAEYPEDGVSEDEVSKKIAAAKKALEDFEKQAKALEEEASEKK